MDEKNMEANNKGKENMNRKAIETSKITNDIYIYINERSCTSQSHTDSIAQKKVGEKHAHLIGRSKTD